MRLAGNQRLLRTLPPHGEGGVLRRGFPQNVLRIAGAVWTRRGAAARPRCVPCVLQPRARPSRLSHPGPHAVSNLVRRGFANAPRGGETRSCLVYNPRHRSPGVRPSPAKYTKAPNSDSIEQMSFRRFHFTTATVFHYGNSSCPSILNRYDSYSGSLYMRSLSPLEIVS